MAKSPKSKAAPKSKRRTDKRGTPKGKGTQKGGRGGRIGNPAFEATIEQRLAVEYLTACGWTQPMIAEKLSTGSVNISEDTLKRHFRAELNEGVARATARLGGTLYEGAAAGDAKKLEMWFDRRGGQEWMKKTALEHSGPNGAPIEYRDLSDEEVEARIRAHEDRGGR
jgi:hypothetical protein